MSHIVPNQKPWSAVAADSSWAQLCQAMDAPSTASLDFLDDDDEVPPPPPPEDEDDTSSTRSSPDDNYGPAPIAPFVAHPEDHNESRPLIPLRFASSDIVFECLEDEGNSGAGHLAEEDLNDDAESYNGGATSTDRDDDDELEDREEVVEEPPFVIREDSTVMYYDPEPSVNTPQRSTVDHPFLDMEGQRRQYEWDRSQQRAQYHSFMQRTTTLSYADRCVAIRVLLHEASRHHSLLRNENRSSLSSEDWRRIGEAAVEDIDQNGAMNVQRNLSCMCMFSGVSAAREYSDHEAERSRRAAMQHRTLQALRMQAARGDSPFFLRSPAASLREPDL